MSSPDAARIHAFERQSLELVADEVTEIPEGWVARAPSLPLVWVLNHVGVTEPIEYPAAMELLERYQADLPYRQLVIEHEPSGEALEPRLRSEGWRFDRDVGLVLRREPDRELDTSAVVEADEAEALELMRMWTGEEEDLQRSPEAHDQVLETIRRTWRTRNARRFGVLGRDGSLAGITMLFSDGVVAQVEDVFVVPEERGRGFGRVMVTHAALAALDAGHEFVFILADDQGWPKHLYADVGFEAVERSWEFHR
ncbi:MAG: GNAT family N-acetyltransferase [Solirubrobacterales bacterium]|nr:GNAT family N-acetyltransferase [Solirubrobacterales bacterium]